MIKAGRYDKIENKIPKVRTTLTLDKDLLDSFRQYCKNQGYKMSTRITILLRQEMDNVEGGIEDEINKRT